MDVHQGVLPGPLHQALEWLALPSLQAGGEVLVEAPVAAVALAGAVKDVNLVAELAQDAVGLALPGLGLFGLVVLRGQVQ